MSLSKLNATVLATALGLASAALAPPAAGQPAGLVLFIKGDVQIRDVDGALRPARKGEPVAPGERLVTGDGAMAQVKLSDGGYVGLRAGSGLRFEPPAAGDAAGGRTMELTEGSVRVLNTGLGANAAPYRLRTPHGEVNVRGGDAVAGVLPMAADSGADGKTRTVVRLNRGTGTAATKASTPLALATGDTVAVSPAAGAPQRIAGARLPQLDTPQPPRAGTGARASGRPLPGALATIRPALPTVTSVSPRTSGAVTGFDYASSVRGVTPVTSAEPTLASDRVLDPNVLTLVTTGRLPRVGFTGDNTRTVSQSLDTGVRTILSTASGSDLTRTATLSTVDTTLRVPSVSTTTLSATTVTTTSTVDPRLSTTRLTGTLIDADPTRLRTGTTSTTGTLDTSTILGRGTLSLSR